MTLRDRVPVEPLAPERLERLEQRIVASAAPALHAPVKPALWPWGLALASAAAAALAVYALRPAPPVAAPQTWSMSTDDGATLTLGDATIAVGPATRFDVNRGGGGIDVRLDHGSVRLDVAPRGGRPPLWVHAGDVGVRVVGTAFTVSRAPGAGDVEVEVEHGTVEVHRGGVIAPVTGGQRWSSRDGSVLAVAPAPGDAVTAGGGAGATAGGGPGTIGAAGSHTAALATGPAIDVAVLGERRGGLAPGGPAGETARSGSAPRARTERTNPATEPAAPAADPIGDLRREISAQRPASATVASRSVADLRALVASSHGGAAAAALYALARTQHVDLAAHADALRSLDAYLTRFPQGAEIEAVRWMRLRILCRGPIGDACRAAAHSYLTQHGGDTARGKLAIRITNVP